MTKFGKIAALALGASVAVAALPSSASAATYINFNQVVGGDFGNDHIGKHQVFSDFFTFTINIARTFSSDVFSSQTDKTDNVNFSPNLVRLCSGSSNCVPQAKQVVAIYGVDSTGADEARSVWGVHLDPGTYQIEVHGSSQENGNYFGDIFLSGVPEPMSWALMIGGFGLVGASMRRRQAVSKVSFG